MLKPYKIIDESELNTTYQYNSLYSWVLLGLLVIVFLAVFFNHAVLQFISSALIVFYFGIKLAFGIKINKIIKQALKSGSVEVSGNKYSFSNPIKVKVTKIS